MIRGQDLILLEWRWFHKLQPISDQPVGLGFPHCAGRFDHGGHRFRPGLVGVVDVWKSF